MRKVFAGDCLTSLSTGDPEQTRYGRGVFLMMMKQATHHILSLPRAGKDGLWIISRTRKSGLQVHILSLPRARKGGLRMLRSLSNV